MKANFAPSVLLFGDGAFSFNRPAASFGWVAIDPESNSELARGNGRIPNDGSNSFAGEAAAAASALEWALGMGFKVIRLCTDFQSLSRHVRVEPKPRHKQARRLFQLCQKARAEAQIEIVWVKSIDPYLMAAHHLARSAA